MRIDENAGGGVEDHENVGLVVGEGRQLYSELSSRVRATNT